MAGKPRVATAWLDGCSGCHMSLLDMDERIIEIASKVEIVTSPLIDIKEFPENVDLALVEGAVSSEEDLAKIRKIRQRTKLLVALGDCAVTGNVPAMRNVVPVEALFAQAYEHEGNLHPQTPTQEVPKLLKQAAPMHAYVKVDLFLPGCPPPAEAILELLTAVLEGREPQTHKLTRFGR